MFDLQRESDPLRAMFLSVESNRLSTRDLPPLIASSGKVAVYILRKASSLRYFRGDYRVIKPQVCPADPRIDGLTGEGVEYIQRLPEFKPDNKGCILCVVFYVRNIGTLYFGTLKHLRTLEHLRSPGLWSTLA